MTQTKVFKFGGASISTVERIQQVGHIMEHHNGEPVLVVVSAMGKTTNALEKVAEAFFEQRSTDALRQFDLIKKQHLTIAKYLLVKEYNACVEQFEGFFTEAEWLLHDRPVREYDYYYDQIVCIGELLSSALVAAYLRECGLDAAWVDVRDVLRTDNNFREAAVNWSETTELNQFTITPLLAAGKLVITQGFIGSTHENESTTLGREGSDYTAAIFANLLDAESQTIWKDVPSVMNADPRQFPNAEGISALSYDEVIEMAYYGAQVIHPKTIKPLFEKRIPLLVKCFLDPNLPGTIISNQRVKNLPPIIVRKEQQVLIDFRSKDYSFVGEHAVGTLYQLLERLNLKPNLTQNGAISFMAVFDDKPEKLEKLATQAENLFDVQMRKGLTLFTIRHFTPEKKKEILGDKELLLLQQTQQTLQAVY
jgi:aspartate kinase